MLDSRIMKAVATLCVGLTAGTAVGGGVDAAVADVEVVAANPQPTSSSPIVVLSFPGMFGVPSAVAPVGGTGFVGATYVNPRGGIEGNDGDGSVSAGYTLGNPVDAVSVTLGVSITGTDPFGDAGSFSVNGSRMLRASDSSVTFLGASASNLGNWGAGSDDEEYSIYGSHLFGFQTGGVEIPLQLVAGYGSNNTRTSVGGLDDGAFAGVGIGLTQKISGSVSFTETQVNTGLTVAVPGTNVGATVGVYDVSNNNDRRQFSLTVGFGF